MNRREFTWLGAGAIMPSAFAADMNTLGHAVSDSDAAAGIRAALARGAQTAIGVLGRTDGFLGDPRVRIPLPERLQRASGLLQTLGQGARLEELHTGMNRAAETAVPKAATLLSDAIRKMTLHDASAIVTGAETSVTQFFSTHTREPLNAAFLPIVTGVIGRLSLARRYDALMSRAAGLGLFAQEHDVSIEQHVTGKALDGLFLMIGEEEKKIRQNPLATGSALLRRVFGAVTTPGR